VVLEVEGKFLYPQKFASKVECRGNLSTSLYLQEVGGGRRISPHESNFSKVEGIVVVYFTLSRKAAAD